MSRKSINIGAAALFGLGRLFPAWFTNPGLLNAIGSDLSIGQKGQDPESTYDLLITQDEPADKGRGSKIVNLHLSPSFFLTSCHPLPRRAAAQAGAALELYIRQNTPFSEADIIWRYGLHTHDKKTVIATLHIIKKQRLESVCRSVEGGGFRVRSVQLKNTDFVFLDRAHSVAPTQRFWRRIGLGALALSLLFAVAASYLTYQKRADTLAFIKAENTGLQDKAIALRTAATAQDEEATRLMAFADQLEKNRTVLPLITALTSLLPDNTWLAQFTLRRTEIRLAGFSTEDPAHLLIQLEESPYFSQVALSGPITHDQRSGQNRFELVMVLEANNE